MLVFTSAMKGLNRSSVRGCLSVCKLSAVTLSAFPRAFSISRERKQKFNMPPSANDLPRMAGITTLFRLPHQKTTQGLDICAVGVPVDWGTSFRSGTRFGPRQIRAESSFTRAANIETGAVPFKSANIADVGDVYVTPYDLKQSVSEITDQFRELMKNGCKTLTIGGDHTITYPILKAVKERYGPVGLVHIDAHMDVNEHMNKCAISHGTTFRRAEEDGCLVGSKVFQLGIRGSSYTTDDMVWPMAKGFNIYRSSELQKLDIPSLMAEIRVCMGDSPVYISFDIDGLDPSIAPGTGTPEIAGLSSHQALDIVRGCKGLNVVGADLVEVSPPYDPSGNTALTAANFLFEMLCVFPEINYVDVPRPNRH